MATCSEIIASSQVQFGTSGVRGLVEEFDDATIFAYTTSFLDYVSTKYSLTPGSQVWFGHDLRPSSPHITRVSMEATRQAGFFIRNCGEISTPALAYSALKERCPSIMITGSHIPFDRNGIKFYRPDGELMKRDEAHIIESKAEFPSGLFHQGRLKTPTKSFSSDPTAATSWINRYRTAFGNLLNGMTIGHYQHSAAGRDILTELLEILGARVIAFGRSDSFVPIDTEAVSMEDAENARALTKKYSLDALVSTDGDGDRPLLADETGSYFRGDTLGMLAALSLRAEHVITPVSTNSAIELCNHFSSVTRTKIGSPNVIEAMQIALRDNNKSVVGFEANGGFLTATTLKSPIYFQEISPLPTRDAILPILAVIALAKQLDLSLSQLYTTLPSRYTASDRLIDTPRQISDIFMESLKISPALIGDLAGSDAKIESLDETDGFRATLTDGNIIHLRPSGNAPELRIYVESTSPDKANQLLQTVTWRLKNSIHQ